jgi:predicted MFS family arabinose efflux permease
MLLVFCPFAAGYFLSYFFRNVNALISRDLATEFSLAPSDLGFLTSMYLLAFAAFQLPLGVLLDRYGPRRVVAALLCIAAAGALLFGTAQGFATLSIGRALIGLGVSAGLMGAIKAFTLWFPLSRLATLNGLYLAVGGLGAISATAPAELLLGAFGWRLLFFLLCALSVAAALLVFFVVPEKALPGRGETLREQVAGFGVIFASVTFWRVALPLVVCQAAYMTLQGLWLGPWLYDVAGQTRDGVASYLLTMAVAFMAGSIFFGAGADRLAGRISRLTMYKLGVSVSVAMFVLLALRVQWGLAAILAVYGFTAISVVLVYALLTPLFAPELTGRLSTASNVLMFLFSFACQWGFGAVLRLYPAVDGRYAPEGYSAALAILAALQLATLAWLLPMRLTSAAYAAQPRL